MNDYRMRMTKVKAKLMLIGKENEEINILLEEIEMKEIELNWIIWV